MAGVLAFLFLATPKVPDSYTITETVQSATKASTSGRNLTALEAQKDLAERGFDKAILQADYTLSGEPRSSSTMTVGGATSKFPLYYVLYATPSGNLWVIHICNDAYMADPIFMRGTTKPPCCFPSTSASTATSPMRTGFSAPFPHRTRSASKP